MELLERVTKELRDRLEELRPQVEEIARLEGALRALDAGGAESGRSRRTSGAQRRAAARPAGSRRRRTRVSGEQRRAQLIALVRENPEVSVREISGSMGTTPNNVYGLIRRLERDGTLKRSEGRFSLGG